MCGRIRPNRVSSADKWEWREIWQGREKSTKFFSLRAQLLQDTAVRLRWSGEMFLIRHRAISGVTRKQPRSSRKFSKQASFQMQVDSLYAYLCKGVNPMLEQSGFSPAQWDKKKNELLLDLGEDQGSFHFSPEEPILNLMSPRSGLHKYKYEVKNDVWLSEADGHQLVELLTRELMQLSCSDWWRKKRDVSYHLDYVAIHERSDLLHDKLIVTRDERRMMYLYKTASDSQDFVVAAEGNASTTVTAHDPNFGHLTLRL
eukprot:g15647.t1